MLFNGGTINGVQLNALNNLEAEIASIDGGVVFNNFVLNDSDAGIYASVVHDEMLPSREVNTANNPSTDGETLISEYFRRKNIKVSGHIIKSDAEELQAFIRTLKGKLIGVNKNLRIKKGGMLREYIALVDNHLIGETIFPDHVPFEVNFVALSGFGRDTSFTTKDLVTVTSAVYTDGLENTGNVQTFLTAILTFSAATGVTEIEIQNVTNGQTLTITENISAGDIIKVNGEIEVNNDGSYSGLNVVNLVSGTEPTISGVIPILDVGENLIKITVTSTSHSYDVSLKTKMKYS